MCAFYRESGVFSVDSEEQSVELQWKQEKEGIVKGIQKIEEILKILEDKESLWSDIERTFKSKIFLTAGKSMEFGHSQTRKC